MGKNDINNVKLEKKIEKYIKRKCVAGDLITIKVSEIAENLGEVYHKVLYSLKNLRKKGIIEFRQGGSLGLHIKYLRTSKFRRREILKEMAQLRILKQKKAYQETRQKKLEQQFKIDQNLFSYINRLEINYCDHRQCEKGMVYYLVFAKERALIYKSGDFKGSIAVIGMFPYPLGNLKFTCSRGVCGIHDIKVIHSEKRKGLGTAMLKYLADIVKHEGVKKINFIVRHEEDETHEIYYNFFEKNGYKVKRKREEAPWGLVYKKLSNQVYLK